MRRPRPAVGVAARSRSATARRRRRRRPSAASRARSACGCWNSSRPFAGVVKPQAAFFELARPARHDGLQDVLRRAKDMGFVTILDAKRGDIASTAAAYADAAFGGCASTASRSRSGTPTRSPSTRTSAATPSSRSSTAARSGRPRGVRAGADEQPRGRAVPGPGVRRQAASTATSPTRWRSGTPRPSGRAAWATSGRWSGRRTRGSWPSCGPRCRTCGSWCRATGRRAAPPRTCGRRSGPTASGRWSTARAGVTFPFHPDDPDWEAKVVAAAKAAAAELRIGG